MVLTKERGGANYLVSIGISSFSVDYIIIQGEHQIPHELILNNGSYLKLLPLRMIYQIY